MPLYPMEREVLMSDCVNGRCKTCPGVIKNFWPNGDSARCNHDCHKAGV
jgi:hypothetical protein